MFCHLRLCIHLNILELYEGLTLFYAATGAKHFLSSFFVKGNAHCGLKSNKGKRHKW